MKNCPFCRGAITSKRIEHVHHWKGRIYILRNVPAEVCAQCGEVFFAPPTLKVMDKIAASRRKPKELVSVPVFSL